MNEDSPLKILKEVIALADYYDGPGMNASRFEELLYRVALKARVSVSKIEAHLPKADGLTIRESGDLVDEKVNAEISAVAKQHSSQCELKKQESDVFSETMQFEA